MQRYILRRLLQGVVLLFVLALIVFALARVTGNPADLMLSDDATPEDRADLMRTLGLDRPLPEQLWTFMAGALRGAGDTRVPILFAWAGYLGLRIPLAYLLTGPLGWGLLGAWWAMVVDLFARGAAFVVRFHGGRWQRVRV